MKRAALIVVGGTVLGIGAVTLWRKYARAPWEKEPLEDYALLQANYTCDLIAKPGVEQFRDYVLKRFGGGDQGIINRTCGQTGYQSEHYEGRAWDWRTIPWTITPYTKPDVEGMLKWLTEPDRDGRPNAIARRAGIMYILWEDRAWRSYDTDYAPKGEWYTYSTQAPHLDHVHISFAIDGAMGRTSLYKHLANMKGQIDG